jgi:hypothetical protein
MMKEPGTKSVKQQRMVQNVRFLGQDRALVDCSVKLTGMEAPDAVWHSTALVALNGGKWLLEDVRFYVVVTGSPPPQPPAAPGLAPTQAAQPDESEPPAAPPKT